MKRFIFISAFISFFLLSYTPAHAQFFKKLGDKIGDAAENTVLNKSADKTSKEVGQGMESIFSAPKKARKKTADLPRPSRDYDFSYRCDMKISTSQINQTLSYYFDQNSDYAGMEIKQNGMQVFMIFDYGKETAYSFFSSRGNKMYSATGIDLDQSNEWANNPYTNSEYTVTKLPDKSFLGYNCHGKRIENDEWQFTMYYTDEINIGFQNILNASKKRETPSVLRKYFADAQNGMMMYMKTVDKKNGKESITMECVNIEKVDHAFDTKAYAAMQF